MSTTRNINALFEYVKTLEERVVTAEKRVVELETTIKDALEVVKTLEASADEEESKKTPVKATPGSVKHTTKK